VKCITSKAAFTRITREIMATFKFGMRLKSKTVDAIQTASEDYLHKLFKKAAALADHAGRDTIMPGDLTLLKQLDDIERMGITNPMQKCAGLFFPWE
jgi:histone H3/H4